MTSWIDWTTGYLWTNALAVLVPAAAVALIARHRRCSPATRHALWIIVLVLFILPPIGAKNWLSRFAQSTQHNAATIDLKITPQNSPAHSVKEALLAWDGVRQLPRIQSVDARCDEINPPDCPTSFPMTPPRTGVAVDSSASASLAWTSSTTRHPSPTLPGCDHWATGLIPFSTANDPIPCDTTPMFIAAPDVVQTRLETGAMHDTPVLPESIVGDGKPGPSATPMDRTSLWQPTMNYAIQLLGVIRAAAAGVPKMPTSVWVLGALLILTGRLVSIVRGRNLLAASRTASLEIQHMVAQCARRVGLQNAPRVRVVDLACPPMVLGLFRTQLLIPLTLWQQLDPIGRQAIILHELAHVRRRDLWVRRFELFVGALCWWHPVVWYARHRLNEEAELCCDAWVTWLLPAQRRTYATALLQAQVFVQESHPVDPAVGIGVVSVRAKRFARRLTMVMTHPSRPALSAGGFVAAMMIALAGWISAPAWANLPANTEPTQAATSDAVSAVEVIQIPAPVPPPEPIRAIETTAPLLAFSTQPNGSLAPLAALMPLGQLDDKAMEERMHRLEEQLRRLEERLAKLGETSGTPRVGWTRPRIAQNPGMIAPTPAIPSTPTPRVRSARPAQPRAFAPGGVFSQGRGGAAGGAVGRTRAGSGDQLYTQVYAVTPAKLDSLLNLMARQDVPVFVARTDNGIEVTANAQQHSVFAAFISMIDPRDDRKAAGTPAPAADETVAAYEDAREAAEELAEDQAEAAREMAEHERDLVRDYRARAMAAEELKAAAKKQQGGMDASHFYSQGYELYNAGDYSAAIEAFRKSADADQRRGESLYNMACCEALAGNHDESLDLLEQAWEAGYQELEHIQQDNDLTSLRNDERYKSFIEDRADEMDREDEEDDADSAR